MGNRPRVFAGRCPPDQKRRERKEELGNSVYAIARKRGLVAYRVRRRPASAANKLWEMFAGRNMSF